MECGCRVVISLALKSAGNRHQNTVPSHWLTARVSMAIYGRLYMYVLLILLDCNLHTDAKSLYFCQRKVTLNRQFGLFVLLDHHCESSSCTSQDVDYVSECDSPANYLCRYT